MHLFLSCIVFIVLVSKAAATFGIPGTTQTEGGYDTELGEKPICWTSTASDVEEDIPFPNPLINDFKIQGEVTLLYTCPALNFITAEAPIEFQRGERLRTGEIYDYKVSITLNLDSLGGNAFFSDEGPVIAVQILVCKLGAGFCSPFIHEESNARLAAKGIFESPDHGDNHGGTHTHSGYEFLRVPPEDGPVYNVSITIPMQVNTAGDNFAIAAVQMYIGDELGESAAMRYDMANAFPLDQRLITYQEPVSIKVVPGSVLIGSYVAIGLVSLVILFLLVETIKNRNHQVLQLTQGYFLIVFLVAALAMAVSSFLLEPKNDFYCNASFPIILTSGQLLYAITLGRLWRINALISPLLIKTLRQKKGFTRRMVESLMSAVGLKIQPRKQGSKNLRKQISHWQLALVVALVTLPQAFIQVLASVLQPHSISIEFNNDESQGRVICDSGFDMKSSLQDYGLWMFLLLVFSLLFIAHMTSQLPSLFNESKVIYESTLFSVVILILGFGVVIVTDDPTASPAVRYLVSVVLTLSITANTSLRIMLPKLQKVWRNEKVVVSRLVSDHVKSTRERDACYANSGNTNFIVTGVTPQEREPSTNTLNSLIDCISVELADEMERDSDKRYDQSHTSLFDFDADGLVNAKHSNSSTAVEKDTSQKSSPSELPVSPMSPPESSGRPKPLNKESLNQNLVSLPSKRQSLSSKILVQCDETPEQCLVLKMVDLQEELMAVNKHIMSGVAVSKEEWTSVRDLTGTLGSTFHDDVDFAWENKEDGPHSSIGEVETELIIEEGEEGEP